MKLNLLICPRPLQTCKVTFNSTSRKTSDIRASFSAHQSITSLGRGGGVGGCPTFSSCLPEYRVGCSTAPLEPRGAPAQGQSHASRGQRGVRPKGGVGGLKPETLQFGGPSSTGSLPYRPTRNLYCKLGGLNKHVCS